MASEDICGYENTELGWPCQNPASDGDSCWIDDHGGDVDRSGTGGRPTKLETMDETERAQLISDIATTIEQGGSIREAGLRVEPHRHTITRWLNRGELDKLDGKDNLFVDFYDRIARAIGESEHNYRSVTFQVAAESGDTATLMAMMKQRHRESWGDVDRGEHAGGVTVDLTETDKFEIDPDTLEVTPDPNAQD